jgi:alkylhydroperoxidase family enzyme
VVGDQAVRQVDPLLALAEVDDDLLEAAPLEHAALHVLDPRVVLLQPAVGGGDELAEVVLALDRPAQRVLDPRLARERFDQRVDLPHHQPVEVRDVDHLLVPFRLQLCERLRGEELGNPRHAPTVSHPVTPTGRPVSSLRKGNQKPSAGSKEDKMALRVQKADLVGFDESKLALFGGRMPEPLEVGWHNPPVVEAALELGMKAAEWDAVEESLKSFAHMAVAALVGCSWCLDIGYFTALNQNLDPAKASQVPRWRESDVFTPLERDVLEYAEAMSTTPLTVSDELSARLLEALGEAGLVELTAYIAFSNFSTRNNVALGIESQGFAANCEIPLAAAR